MNVNVNEYALCGLSSDQYKEMLVKYLNILFPSGAEYLYDYRCYSEVSEKIAKMFDDAALYRSELADLLIEKDYVKCAVNVMKELDSEGVFTSYPRWLSSYYMYNINRNFSKVSIKYSQELLKHGISDLLIANIGHQPYIKILSRKNVSKLMELSLGILHNMVRFQESEMLLPFKEKNVRGNLLELIKSENDMIKGLAALILAYIIDEDDQGILEKVSGSVNYLMSCLQKALNSSEEQFSGFTVAELAQGLAALTVNDNLKKVMDENGIIPLLVKLASSAIEEKIIPSIKALWNLSFDKNIGKKLVETYKVIPIMEKYVNSTDPNVLKSSNGVLWNLRDESLSQQKANLEKSKEPVHNSYAFISYNWEHQEKVKSIREELKNQAINVWIDIEKMKGCTLEAMADGIENCAAVIMFMSDSYKRSANCRVEAEYAFTLKKPIIPILLDNNYKPIGWLGIILGAKLYYDLSGDCFSGNDTILQGMIKDLREAMKTS